MQTCSSCENLHPAPRVHSPFWKARQTPRSSLFLCMVSSSSSSFFLYLETWSTLIILPRIVAPFKLSATKLIKIKNLLATFLNIRNKNDRHPKTYIHTGTSERIYKEKVGIKFKWLTYCKICTPLIFIGEKSKPLRFPSTFISNKIDINYLSIPKLNIWAKY